ncbi:MAG: hypothetical protein IJ724_04650 [Muribaculaceae bacterium]|nr:hypothetical protein [Muribaculaceae bacterium]
MKKIFLLLTLSLSFLASRAAYDYPFLAFVDASGTVQSFDVTSLAMTYSDGVLTVTNASESKTLNVNELVKMYFSTSSSISDLLQADAAVEVYTIEGHYLGKYSINGRLLQGSSLEAM